MNEPAVTAIDQGTTSTRAIAFDLGAVGVAGAQRETTVVWERVTGRPVQPAIVWQERCLGRGPSSGWRSRSRSRRWLRAFRCDSYEPWGLL